MRRNILLGRCLSLLAAILILATPMLRETGQVLCVGTDGHVSVEASSEGRCSDVSPVEVAPLQEQGEAAGDGHCGSCTDFSILAASESALRSAGPVEPDGSGVVAETPPKSNRTYLLPNLVAARSLAATRASAPVLAVVRLI